MTQAANLGALGTNVNSTGIAQAAGGGTGQTSFLAGVSGQVFTANGTFTIPAGITALKVTVLGAGGGGGSNGPGGVASSPGAGGAGGMAISYLTGLTPGNTLAVTIGSAGIPVSSGSATDGTASTVASGTQTISTITGGGGTGGIWTNTAGYGDPGGAGGTASGGTLNIQGNPGGVGGNSGSGNNYTSAGGSSWFGSGGAARKGPITPAPSATGYGAGGGGTTSLSSAGYLGGYGTNGLVIFEW